jgi:short-subunit dehydrogenase
VTGASSGIGLALCHRLAREKINLMISGRDLDSLNRLADKLRPKVDVTVYQADLLYPLERKKIIEAIRERIPDLIVNNAGFGLYGEALSYKTEEQMNILEINANAVLELTLEGARTLISASKPGTILNVSSAAAFLIIPNFAVYSASKAFVSQFSQALDEETRSQGVRVLTTCPGRVETEFRKRAGGKKESEAQAAIMTPEFAAEEIWRQIQKKNPIHIFDWKYRLGIFLSRLFPNRWMMPLMRKSIETLRED